MKNLLLIAGAIILLSACLTDSKVARGICKTIKDSTRIKDSSVVHYRDSVILHPEKNGGEINLVFGDNCDSLRSVLEAIKKHPVVTKKNGITETVSSKDGKSLDFDCKEDAYADSLKNARIDAHFWHFEHDRIVQERKIECSKEHRTRFDHFKSWWFWISVLLIILVIIWKTRYSWMHLVFPKV